MTNCYKEADFEISEAVCHYRAISAVLVALRQTNQYLSLIIQSEQPIFLYIIGDY